MNELIMLIGIPASGKSTIANTYKEKENWVVHSSDEIRVELLNNVNDQSKNTEIFQELFKRVKSDLKLNKNVLIDSTNLSSKRRYAFLSEIKKFDCTKKAIVMATPYNECIDRDLTRKKKVGISVIEHMYKSFQMPYFTEGFNEIELIYSNKNNEFDIVSEGRLLSTIEQNHPSHTKTIGEHCWTSFIHVCDRSDDKKIQYAVLLHDYGKKFCKGFKDFKGHVTNIAHYYGHENVSAYDSMFYLKQLFTTQEVIYIANLIQYHMRPFDLKTEKSINKFLQRVPEKMWEDILLIHEADIEAK